MKEHELDKVEFNGWVCVEIRQGAYGLPQVVMLANDMLKERFKLAGYYPTSNIPGLCWHQLRPIMFALVVDDFGVDFIGKGHVKHLVDALNSHYEIAEDLECEKYPGIDLKWNY